MIDRHSGARQGASSRANIKDAAATLNQAAKKAEREIGQGPRVDVDDRELFSAVKIGGEPREAEASVIDDERGFDLTSQQVCSETRGRAGITKVDSHCYGPWQTLRSDLIS